MLKTFPISVTYIKNAHVIFGPGIGSLRVKTVRKNRNSDVRLCGNPQTDKIKDESNWINCWSNVCQQDPVRDITWENVKFATIENVVDQKAATLLKSLRSIKSVYINKNIFIKKLYVDSEFEVLRDALQGEGITLNNTAADGQVPQIERQVKMVKERVRSTWNSLPYKKISDRMISCMVENAVFFLNALPINIGM